MSSISKEVFNQLISSRTLHEIIDDKNVSFTSIKHDFNIRRKSFIVYQGVLEFSEVIASYVSL